jgi:hypothetical protein
VTAQPVLPRQALAREAQEPVAVGAVAAVVVGVAAVGVAVVAVESQPYGTEIILGSAEDSMNRYKLVMLLGSAMLALSSAVVTAHAQTGQQDPPQDRLQTQERVVYGSQLMTQQERLEYRNRMGNAATPQEREQIRAQHHSRIQVRAQERGMTLPDAPPRQGGGMGPGRGMGGMGGGRR